MAEANARGAPASASGAADMRALLVAAILATTAFTGTAHACAVAGQLNIDDVARADLVVVGRISHYEIVLNQRAREQRRRLLQNSDMSRRLREILRPQTSYLSDYARFRITVRQSLAGEAPRTLTVTWTNSTFREPPSLAPGEYLVALSVRRDEQGADHFSVFQMACDPAFLFESDSGQAQAVRRRLAE
jgi:hypothetical protein